MASLWIDNLVDGLLLVLDHPDAAGGTFLLSDERENLEQAEYLRGLAAAFGKRPPRVSLTEVRATQLARLSGQLHAILPGPPPITAHAVEYVCRRSRYDGSRAREVLGFRPRVGFEEGMARLADHASDREGAE